jgi:large subunit ribosomal protein L23
MNNYEVIRRPVVTEKAAMAQAHNTYVFEVDKRASKSMIRQAVEVVFGVKVAGVRTNRVPGKRRRARKGRGQVAMTAPWKKALVTLVEGEKLELFEGA